MKVEAAVLDSPSLISLMVSVDVKPMKERRFSRPLILKSNTAYLGNTSVALLSGVNAVFRWTENQLFSWKRPKKGQLIYSTAEHRYSLYCM